MSCTISGPASWPVNRSPQIIETRLDSKTSAEDVIVDANGRYQAKVVARDPDGDTLRYRWEIMLESEATQEGGDREQVPMTLAGLIVSSESDETEVQAPAEPGAYRLFVYVYDGQGHAGHANIPFLVR